MTPKFNFQKIYLIYMQTIQYIINSFILRVKDMSLRKKELQYFNVKKIS